MKCKSLPFYEFRDGIYEVDEFDCVSMFVIVGSERSLVIDTGTGIGDFKWVVENRIIPNQPYDVVASHNHLDHIGGAGWFDEIYMHEADIIHGEVKESNGDSEELSPLETIEDSANAAERRKYAKIISKREGKYYPYNLQEDILVWPKQPKWIPIKDEHVFDLGNRKVICYHCPGHTKGELVFLDNLTRTLIVGDAVNCNFYFRTDLAETPKEGLKIAYEAVRRIDDMKDQYDYVINSHHDFRGFGNSLNPETIGNLMHCLESLVNQTADFKTVVDPLSNDGETRTSAVYGNVEVSTFGKPAINEL